MSNFYDEWGQRIAACREVKSSHLRVGMAVWGALFERQSIHLTYQDLAQRLPASTTLVAIQMAVKTLDEQGWLSIDCLTAEAGIYSLTLPKVSATS